MARASLVAAVLLGLAAFAAAQGITDIDVLNFALNLECLEAEFYSYAAFGVGLSAADRGNGPAPIGGKKALLGAATQAYAEAIARDEIAHVRFLRAALGNQSVPCPLINIGSAFGVAANVAVNATLAPAFDPYGSDVTFLHGAFIFEDVGVTAYKGAAPLIVNKAYLEAAAGILAVEAYHGGSIRTLLAAISDTYVFPYGVDVETIIGAIANLRAVLGGVPDAGIIAAPPAEPAFVTAPANEFAVVYSRTPAQVLNIVYFGQARGGGFFPNGINGNIR